MLTTTPPIETCTQALPTPREILTELPLLPHLQEFISRTRQTIARIVDSKDPRFLLIVGPCSLHDQTSAHDFAIKLKALSEIVSEKFLIVMRAYFEKPRTSLGWKGLVYDPFLDGSNQIPVGLRWTRKILLNLVEMEMPVATEFLDPSTAIYFRDLVSWGCIGARTSASQIHRQMASGLPMPIAFKNNTDGNVVVAVQGVLAARFPSHFIGIDLDGKISTVQTSGNPYGHIVLRGGESKENYDPPSIAKALESLKKHCLPQNIIVDCSHDNSQRKHEQQCSVFRSVFHQFLEGNHAIRGMILESHLHGGNQLLTESAAPLKYGISITDPCLDWAMTEQLILEAYALCKQQKTGKGQ